MSMKSIEHYDADEVAIWLSCIGLGQKSSAFREHGIDGSMLVTLTENEFQEDLGLSRLQAKKVQQQLAFTKKLVEASSKNLSDDQLIKQNNELQAKKINALESEILRLKNELYHCSQNGTNYHHSSHKLYHHDSPPYAPSAAVPVVQAVPVNTNYHHNQQQAVPVNSNNHQHQQQAPNTYSAYPYQTPPKKSSKTTNMATGAVGGAATGAATGAMKGAIMGAILPGVSASQGAKAGAAAGAAGGGLKGVMRGALR
jgi:hypothetical protein